MGVYQSHDIPDRPFRPLPLDTSMYSRLILSLMVAEND
jgi:hypothetical protein